MSDQTILQNLEQELVPPEVSKYAPLKNRGQSLETIKASIRKTISDLDTHIRELEDYLTALKQSRDQITRSLG
jgi:peptidoglycan hydrolase CwlO-like protein